MRRLLQVRDLETACPHHRFCLRDTDWVNRASTGCIVDGTYTGCPMYRDIDSGGSPWNWRMPPGPESKWWEDNEDEITLRPPTSNRENRLVEIEEKSTKVY